MTSEQPFRGDPESGSECECDCHSSDDVSVIRPLGFPQPPSNAPGLAVDQPDNDDVTVGSTISSHSKAAGGGFAQNNRQITRRVSNDGQITTTKIGSRDWSSTEERHKTNSQTTTRDRQSRSQRKFCRTRSVHGYQTQPSFDDGNSAEYSSRNSGSRSSHSSSMKSSEGRRNSFGRSRSLRSDGSLRVHTGPNYNHTEPNYDHTDSDIDSAKSQSENDSGALQLRESAHNRKLIFAGEDGVHNRKVIFVGEEEDGFGGSVRKPCNPVAEASEYFPYTSAKLAASSGSASSHKSRNYTPPTSAEYYSSSFSNDAGSRATRSEVAGNHYPYDDEGTFGSGTASAKAGVSIVAEVVDEAKLEAEIAARLWSRIVQATEIRPSETISESVVESSCGRKRKRVWNRCCHRCKPGEFLMKRVRIILCVVIWSVALVVASIVVLVLVLPKESNGEASEVAIPINTTHVQNSTKHWWETLPEINTNIYGIGNNGMNPVEGDRLDANESLTKESYLREMAKQMSGSPIPIAEATPQGLALEWMLKDPYTISGIVDQEGNPEAKLAERYALATLYYSTSGDGWFDGMGFLNASSVCDWHGYSSDYKEPLHTQPPNGVVCNHRSDVVGLRLDHNNLMGTIPIELEFLSQIKTLQMSSNKGLVGTIPTEIGRLVHTTALTFSSCNLIGTFPDALRGLSDLTLFSVYQNQLTGTLPKKFLEAVTGLQYGDFGSNQFKGAIPNTFERLSALQTLYLNDNYFSGTIPSSLYFSPSLQILDFSINDLEGTIAPQISAMENLRHFALDQNQFSETLPSQLAQLTDLEYFSASYNDFSGTFPMDASKLQRLTHLDLSFNNFTSGGNGPDVINELSSLVFLNLESNPLYDGLFSVGASDFKLSSLVEARLKNTRAAGLNQTFCGSDGIIPGLMLGSGVRIQADCLEEGGSIECGCCTSCCESGGTDCIANTDAICNLHRAEFQGMWDDILQQRRENFSMECHCRSDSKNPKGLHNIMCNDRYQIIDQNATAKIDTKNYVCLKDSSFDDIAHNASHNASHNALVCAANTNYGFTFDGILGEELSFQNTIVYGENSARWNGTSVLFRSYKEEEGPYCDVWIDGQQCEECIPRHCGERHDGKEDIGFAISCQNLDNGYTFDSCSDDLLSFAGRQAKNGYLEIFHAALNASIAECHDQPSCTTGKLPIFLKFLQKGKERGFMPNSKSGTKNSGLT